MMATGRTRFILGMMLLGMCSALPAAFNLVTIDETSIAIQHLRWDAGSRHFVPSDHARFGRHRSA